MKVSYLFLGIIAGIVAWAVMIPKVSKPMVIETSLKTSTYDIKEIKAPRVAGLPLVIFSTILKTPLIGDALRTFLIWDNDFDILERFSISMDPYTMPMYEPLGNPGAEDVAKQEKLAAAPQKETYSSKSKSAELTKQYLAGTLSPVDVVEKTLKNIQASNNHVPKLNAFVLTNREDSLEQAKASALRYKNKKPLSPLDGVPIGIKAEFGVKGYLNNHGTTFMKNVETEDSTPVRLLREAGAIIVGITHMHEIGIGTFGDNPHYGPARNPHDLNRHTGGSSSGSGAAVGSGLVPLALGADGGGSIRIPGSLCGAVGLMPTWNRVTAETDIAWTVGHTGPIAASVEDAAIMYRILAQNGPRPHSAAVDLKKLRVGVYKQWNDDSAPCMRSGVENATRALREAGATIVELTIPHMGVFQKAHALTILSEMALGMQRHRNEHFTEFSHEAQVNLGLVDSFSTLDFLSAARVRRFAVDTLRRMFKEVDVLLSPATAIVAPIIQPDVLSHGVSDIVTTAELMRYVYLQNLVGNPSITVPVGYDDVTGMPVSVQISADFWDEHVILGAGDFLAKNIPVKDRTRGMYFD